MNRTSSPSPSCSTQRSTPFCGNDHRRIVRERRYALASTSSTEVSLATTRERACDAIVAARPALHGELQRRRRTGVADVIHGRRAAAAPDQRPVDSRARDSAFSQGAMDLGIARLDARDRARCEPAGDDRAHERRPVHPRGKRQRSRDQGKYLAVWKRDGVDLAVRTATSGARSRPASRAGYASSAA